jgi:DNA-binding NarL/FixJ family response regulator
MKTIRVLLADDHTLVRAGIRSLLQNLPDIEVVAEANNGREALALLETCHPDVVLMDIAMPGLNGLEAVARITGDFPYIRVIILSMYANEEYVLRALRAGAAGYLLKDAGPVELELAINAASHNKIYLSPAISKHVAEYVRQAPEETVSSPLERLTPRQREILQLIAEGRTTPEIAHLLQVSVKTVDTHRTQLMDRLDIHDIAGLVRYAIRVGLITAEE